MNLGNHFNCSASTPGGRDLSNESISYEQLGQAKRCLPPALAASASRKPRSV